MVKIRACRQNTEGEFPLEGEGQWLQTSPETSLVVLVGRPSHISLHHPQGWLHTHFQGPGIFQSPWWPHGFWNWGGVSCKSCYPSSPSFIRAKGKRNGLKRRSELAKTQGRWSGWGPEMTTVPVNGQTSRFCWCHRHYSWIYLKENGKYINHDFPTPSLHPPPPPRTPGKCLYYTSTAAKVRKKFGIL